SSDSGNMQVVGGFTPVAQDSPRTQQVSSFAAAGKNQVAPVPQGIPPFLRLIVGTLTHVKMPFKFHTPARRISRVRFRQIDAEKWDRISGEKAPCVDGRVLGTFFVPKQKHYRRTGMSMRPWAPISQEFPYHSGVTV